MKFRKGRSVSGILIFIALILAFPLWRRHAQDQRLRVRKSKADLQRRHLAEDRAPDQSPVSAYTIVRTPEGTSCRQMTSREYRQLGVQKRLVEMRAISTRLPSVTQQAGLKIILRGTTQLDQSPEAKAAFQRAAAKWEGVIQDPITIVMDVDYGTTRFGTSYPPGVVGATDPSSLVLRDGYDELRAEALLPSTTDPIQSAAYTALPAGSLPTDLGPTTSVTATSPQFRMLGYLPPEANPDEEEARIGPPPSIGFNSEFGFDFNPADGIDPSKFDFEATAIHEIGHALGFISNVGFKELIPGFMNAPTLWDFFRFTPGGLTFDEIRNQRRLQLAGGEHGYFAGDAELALSTSDPAGGGGGDGRQASHWKDDLLTGQYIGVMDPSISDAQAGYLTAADVRAALLFGYAVNPETRVFDVLSVDDSSPEEILDMRNALYVNRFTPSRFPSMLHSLRIFFLGEPDPAGQSARVVAFIDPNRTGQPPANPTLIADFTLAIPDHAFAFKPIDIPLPTPVAIASGDLYVGIQTSSSMFRFAGDIDNKQAEASFVSTDNGANFQPLRDASGAPINLMLSAIVSNRYGATPTPIATAMSPSAVPPGSAGFTLIVRGGGFRPDSAVRWNGANRTTTFVSGGELRAQIPAADVASAGAAKVSVATPTAGPTAVESAGLNFSITGNNPAPAIARLAPAAAAVGAPALAVNVFGGNFTSQSVVLLNGTALSTTRPNSAQLTAQIPASALAAAGTSKISVSTPGPGGGNSSELNFDVVTCGFTLLGQSQPYTSFGANSSVLLNTASPCAWTAAADQPWITITSPSSNNGGNGAGKYVIDFSVAPNTGTALRTSNLTIGGQTRSLRELGRATAVSAASYSPNIAPDSIVALFGGGLAIGSHPAPYLPLPTTLGGAVVSVTLDSGDGFTISTPAPLFYASPNQINFLMPRPLIPLDDIPIVVRLNGVAVADARPVVAATAPGLFTVTADGKGIPAAIALRIKADGSQVYEPILRFDQSQNKFVTVPIDLGPEGERVFVILFATGIRGRSDLGAVTLKVGDLFAPVLFAGPQGDYFGVDQVNAELPRALAGKGDVMVNLTVDNTPANAVTITIE